MVNTPTIALSNARKIKVGYGGLCLKFVRTVYGIGPKHPSAISAWNNSPDKVSESNPDNIPIGAPIFFSGSRYGHTAIYTGNSRMITTDSSNNRVYETSFTTGAWSRYKLLGYVRNLNGVTIPGLGKPANKPKPTVPSGTLKRGSSGDRVKAYQRYMNRVYPAYSKLAVDGSYGPATESVTKEYERRIGAKITGTVPPARLAAFGI